MPTVPLPGLASNAATTARACAIAAADGVNTSLMTGTWAGWIAILPVKPSRRASSVSRRRGAGKAKRAREPVGVEEAAIAVAVRLRAELGRKVLGSPGQSFEPGARPAIGTGEKQRGRGLGRDRHDLDRTLGQTRDRLTRQKLRIGTNDIGAAFCLRQHDGVGTRGHDGVEIGVGKTGRKSVDANEEARAVRSFGGTRDESRRPYARIGLALRRNRIFEIDDHRVGAARHRLVELFCV